MTATIPYLVVVAFAGVGATLMYRAKMPAGVLLGAILGSGVGLGVLGFPELYTPSIASRSLQVIAGVVVGLRISRNSLKVNFGVVFASLIVTTLFILTSVLAADAVAHVFGVSPQTALFAAVPGGLTEMVSVGVSFGADGPTVAAIHLMRILIVMSLVNALLPRFRNPEQSIGSSCVGGDVNQEPETEYSVWRSLASLLGSVVLGVLGGIVGITSGIPAGGVLGALVGSAAVQLTVGNSIPVRKLQLSFQLFAGLVIGFGITGELLSTLASIIGSAFTITIVQIGLWLGAIKILERIAGYDRVTAVFAAAPGGLSEFSTTASLYGANGLVVAFNHLARLTMSITLAPLIISLILTS